MQEQITAPFVVRTREQLKEAIRDLEFFGNLAITKGTTLEVELWAERGAVVGAEPLPKNADPAIFAKRRIS